MTPISAETCTKAWIAAATHLESQPDHRDYTIILEIEHPHRLSDAEKRVYSEVDSFLKGHGSGSLNTVINTIFPATLYKRHGREEVLRKFSEIGPLVGKGKHPDCRWGSYALRLTTERLDPKGRTFSPLEAIIDKLKGELALEKGAVKASYELNLVEPFLDIPIYDCTTDRGPRIGGPCLTHLSFKLTHDRRLMLTAFYRSHYYMERALGNLYGLAWLQHFVADSVGIPSAQLVCISSMATLDVGKWTKREVANLLRSAREHVPVMGTELWSKNGNPAPAA